MCLFKWDTSREDRKQYEKWLENNIKLPNDCRFYRASSNRKLLSASIGNYNVNGTLDTLIVDADYAAGNNIPGGI